MPPSGQIEPDKLPHAGTNGHKLEQTTGAQDFMGLKLVPAELQSVQGALGALCKYLQIRSSPEPEIIL